MFTVTVSHLAGVQLKSAGAYLSPYSTTQLLVSIGACAAGAPAEGCSFGDLGLRSEDLLPENWNKNFDEMKNTR